MTERKTIEVPAGELSYIDRGHGRPVVFVHGNPSSAEEFVPVMAMLGDGVRCVAPDHVGFGRSSKPPDWDYLPTSHAANLALLLDPLDLHDATVVVGDWGGPIGLSWVLNHPERVGRVVITNTWLWPVDRSLYYQAFSKLMGGPLGRWATRNHNAFARLVVRQAWGRATPLTPELHASFTSVHAEPDERNGMWVFPREITGSSAWLAGLWERRSVLHDIDMHIVWGLRDIAFRADVLDRWTTEFPEAAVDRLADVGHFPALEATDHVVEAIRRQRPS